jgi:hypothetical protein
MKPDSEPVIKLLLKAALMGIQARRFRAAGRLLDHLSELPGNEVPARLLRAFLSYTATGSLDGRHQLIDLLADHPYLQIARAFLALQDRDSGSSGWQGLAESVLDAQAGGAHVKLARYVLGVLQSDSPEREDAPAPMPIPANPYPEFAVWQDKTEPRPAQ